MLDLIGTDFKIQNSGSQHRPTQIEDILFEHFGLMLLTSGLALDLLQD